MGAVGEFEKEKLIVGVIYNDLEVYDKAIGMLVEEFGEIELESERFSFTKEYSSYYDDEIGGESFRVILSFRETVDPSRQAEIKLFTNRIEDELSVDGKRKINLDPGLINHGRLTLATTKPTGFRTALSDGIYTELTLFYARGNWQKLPWTYRDYQSERVQKFLRRVRNIYLKQRQEAKGIFKKRRRGRGARGSRN